MKSLAQGLTADKSLACRFSRDQCPSKLSSDGGINLVLRVHAVALTSPNEEPAIQALNYVQMILSTDDRTCGTYIR